MLFDMSARASSKAASHSPLIVAIQAPLVLAAGRTRSTCTEGVRHARTPSGDKTPRVRMRMGVAVLVLGATAMVTIGASPVAATAPGWAPADRPGPALTVPAATAAAALKCVGNPATSHGEPVLLNPATGVTPEQNYSWNYERAFTAAGRAWCAITMPFHTLGDIQTAGEYLVYSIRTMYARAHQRIAVMGH